MSRRRPKISPHSAISVRCSRSAHSFAAIALVLSVATGCARAELAPSAASEPSRANVGAPSAAAPTSPEPAKFGPTSRKIIRQAELELQVESPGATQTTIERIAEVHGGYVVSATRDTETGSAVDVAVTVAVRVPVAELTSTLSEVKRLGRGVGSERISSDDVTDEYVDLTARMNSQKQLEQQYLEILKRATTVKDMMEVQKELAEVRTEIERMQGRQQLLDKESAFSTLIAHLSTSIPKLAVSRMGITDTVRRAWSDAQSTSADLLSAAIRASGVIAPVFVLVILPSVLLAWALVRVTLWRSERRQRARRVAATA